MGKRFLKRNIVQPLLDLTAIEKRLDAVQYLHEFQELAVTVHDHLGEIHDIERLLSRFIIGKIFPRSFIALMNSIRAALRIKSLLSEQPHDQMRELSESIPDAGALAGMIKAAIEDEPALSPEIS